MLNWKAKIATESGNTSCSSLLLRMLGAPLYSCRIQAFFSFACALHFIYSNPYLALLTVGLALCPLLTISCAASGSENEEILLVRSYLESEVRSPADLKIIRDSILEIGDATLIAAYDKAVAKYPVFQKQYAISEFSAQADMASLSLTEALAIASDERFMMTAKIEQMSPNSLVQFYSFLVGDEWPYHNTDDILALNGAAAIAFIIEYLSLADSLELIAEVPITLRLEDLDEHYYNEFYYLLFYMANAYREPKSIAPDFYARNIGGLDLFQYAPVSGLEMCAPLIAIKGNEAKKAILDGVLLGIAGQELDYFAMNAAFRCFEKLDMNRLPAFLEIWPSETYHSLFEKYSITLSNCYDTLPAAVRGGFDKYITLAIRYENYEKIANIHPSLLRTKNIRLSDVILYSEKPIKYVDYELSDSEYIELRKIAEKGTVELRVAMAIQKLKRTK